ncbi:hypothetical protein DOTSEDRAFT_37299 [Dothistroma septosporum NZE10]|uniref:Uncharacterized protein n=1 Tax=Dothistroma septosporum (strain NZE10 / CBS 128990) TaxID=675120 RepID=N1PED0_DOTSN|nr:hypothetical protein DOTSEDRAFT_37299 [Dothistroma septosporum NZE10]
MPPPQPEPTLLSLTSFPLSLPSSPEARYSQQPSPSPSPSPSPATTTTTPSSSSSSSPIIKHTTKPHPYTFSQSHSKVPPTPPHRKTKTSPRNQMFEELIQSGWEISAPGGSEDETSGLRGMYYDLEIEEDLGENLDK